MILSEDQLKQTIKPMVEGVKDPEAVSDALVEMIRQDREVFMEEAPGETSDGYHTFRELYRYRMLYNALLFNAWAVEGEFDVHKSWYHGDGELAFGGGWFVVVAELPTGQITNHYKEEFWGLFELDERETANEYDGHTPEQVADRLQAFLEGKGEEGLVEGGSVQ